MKKTKVLLLGFVLLVLLSTLAASCIMRRGEPLTGKEFAPANANIANGERMYMVHCQKCHPGGEAGLGPAINPNPAPGFIKRFQVRHGLGVMPSFKRHEISRQDLHNISKYMKAWKHY
jgi:mono/diheme cytochrome c family protein